MCEIHPIGFRGFPIRNASFPPRRNGPLATNQPGGGIEMTNQLALKRRIALFSIFSLISTAGALAVGSQARASTLSQNVSWTIDRAGTTAKYRIAAYGDSIYAGYNGSVTS